MNSFLLAAKNLIFLSEFPAIRWEPRSAPREPARTIFTLARFSTRHPKPITGPPRELLACRHFAVGNHFGGGQLKDNLGKRQGVSCSPERKPWRQSHCCGMRQT